MKNNCPICNSISSFEGKKSGAMVPCPECGNLFVLKEDCVVPVICPDCENEVAPGDRICVKCGYNFDTGKKVKKHIPVYGEDFPASRKAIDAVADFIPGLFKIHILLLFSASIFTALLIIYLSLFMLGLGALITCVICAVSALIVYAHGVGFLMTGEIQMLRSAMVELTGYRWTFFLIMVFGPPITVFMITFKIGTMLAGMR
jgi:hypothetical protein